MRRLTKTLGGGRCELDGATVEEAVRRLATYENLFDRVRERQARIPEEMAALRAEGREKSNRFRELMGEKLTGAALLRMLEEETLRR